MDVAHAPARTRERVRARASLTGNGVLPPIQLRTNGQPISIIDSVVSAFILGITLAAIAKFVGLTPASFM